MYNVYAISLAVIHLMPNTLAQDAQKVARRLAQFFFEFFLGVFISDSVDKRWTLGVLCLSIKPTRPGVCACAKRTLPFNSFWTKIWVSQSQFWWIYDMEVSYNGGTP